jgi:hypothetical protein
LGKQRKDSFLTAVGQRAALAKRDDVFFAARDRKKEIKEQIKQRESGLARQHPKRPRAKKRS